MTIPSWTWSADITAQPDGEAFVHIYTGGIKSVERDKDAWLVKPILDSGRITIKGLMTRSQMQSFLTHYNLKFVAFSRFGWNRGQFYSLWTPYILGEKIHAEGPAELWGNIASNLARQRIGNSFGANPTLEQVSKLVDDRTDSERLAKAISLSLKSMDLSVDAISSYYFEQLSNHLASGNLGSRVSSTRDNTLFAHVHSFFMHFGAVRDYLATFCASRMGKDIQRIDSLARLIPAAFTNDPDAPRSAFRLT